MGLLKLSDRYGKVRLENACAKALEFTAVPSYKAVKNILVSLPRSDSESVELSKPVNEYGITRGASYYKR